MTDRLKPCPFCGGNAGIYYDYHGWGLVQCKECGIRTLFNIDKKKIIEQWNTRKPMDRIVEQIEGMFGVDPIYYGKEAKWAVDKAIEIVKGGGKDV